MTRLNNTVILVVAISADGQGKPALILIHGWSNNKDIWDAQVSHFAEKYKVVAVDLASFGESGNNRREWTMAAFAKDVIAVIEKLKLSWKQMKTPSRNMFPHSRSSSSRMRP